MADPLNGGRHSNVTGHVGMTFDPGDPTTDFSFGWIQFMKQVTMTVIYAGREDAEEQITLDLLPLVGTASSLSIGIRQVRFSVLSRRIRLAPGSTRQSSRPCLCLAIIRWRFCRTGTSTKPPGI